MRFGPASVLKTQTIGFKCNELILRDADSLQISLLYRKPSTVSRRTECSDNVYSSLPWYSLIVPLYIKSIRHPQSCSQPWLLFYPSLCCWPTFVHYCCYRIPITATGYHHVTSSHHCCKCVQLGKCRDTVRAATFMERSVVRFVYERFNPRPLQGASYGLPQLNLVLSIAVSGLCLLFGGRLWRLAGSASAYRGGLQF